MSLQKKMLRPCVGMFVVGFDPAWAINLDEAPAPPPCKEDAVVTSFTFLSLSEKDLSADRALKVKIHPCGMSDLRRFASSCYVKS